MAATPMRWRRGALGSPLRARQVPDGCTPRRGREEEQRGARRRNAHDTRALPLKRVPPRGSRSFLPSPARADIAYAAAVSSPVASLAAALAGHVSAIRQAAAASPAGGGTAWDELLRHYGIVATDPAERALAVRQLGLVRGATPGEVRMAMLGASRWARAELDRLARDPSIAA